VETVFLTVQGKAELKSLINENNSFLVKEKLWMLLILFASGMV